MDCRRREREQYYGDRDIDPDTMKEVTSTTHDEAGARTRTAGTGWDRRVTHKPFASRGFTREDCALEEAK